MLLAVTDNGGTTHLVTDEAMAVGRRYGRYMAECGGDVLAASLTMPESLRCRACADAGSGRGWVSG